MVCTTNSNMPSLFRCLVKMTISKVFALFRLQSIFTFLLNEVCPMKTNSLPLSAHKSEFFYIKKKVTIDLCL